MYARAREERGDVLAREILEIADAPCADQVAVQHARNRIDTKWLASKLAPRKYGDHISHEAKGPGPSFQLAILIQCSAGEAGDIEVSAPTEAGSGVLLDGNGDIVRAR